MAQWGMKMIHKPHGPMQNEMSYKLHGPMQNENDL